MKSSDETKGELWISVPVRYNFRNFEEIFLPSLNNFIKARSRSSRTLIDISKVTWMDLMEAMCLSIVADRIVRETNSSPEFFIHTPKSALPELYLSPDEEKSFSFAKKTQPFAEKYDGLFYHFIVPWHLLTTLYSKELPIHSRDRLGNNIIYDENLLSYLYGLKHWGSSKTFVEISSVLNVADASEVTEKIKGDMKKKIPRISEEERFDFSHAVSRICENIAEHAYKPEDKMPKTGLVAVRRIKSLKKTLDTKPEILKAYPDRFKEFFLNNLDSDIFEIIIVDGGRGIYNTLDPYKKGTELQAIRESFKKGKTSKRYDQGDPERGQGLFNVKKDISKWHGLLEMRSGSSRIAFAGESDKPIDEQDGKLSFLPGVQIRMFVPMEKLYRQTTFDFADDLNP